MDGAVRKVRSRLIAWNTDAWNHSLRLLILTPLLILLGGGVSIFLQTELTHRGYSSGPEGVVTLVIVMTALTVGYVVLALVD